MPLQMQVRDIDSDRGPPPAILGKRWVCPQAFSERSRSSGLYEDAPHRTVIRKLQATVSLLFSRLLLVLAIPVSQPVVVPTG